MIAITDTRTNSFGKYFFKTNENLRKIINVRLVNNAGDFKKYVIKPSFILQKTFSKNFVAIHQIKSVLTLAKPIDIGFSIFALSKLLIHEFN